MADGIGGALKQTATDIGEAIVKPVTDEVGKAIEEGAQQVTGSSQVKPLDPVVQQAKLVEDQKKRAWAIRVIEWNKKLQEEQQKVRQQNFQQDAGKKQEDQEKKKIKQFQIVEKQQKQMQMDATQKAARKTEMKGGVGG